MKIKDKEFHKSKTYKNLQKAFETEIMGFVKYKFFASKAEEEYYPISQTFEETALNEYEHAEVWFKLLNDGELPSVMDSLKEAVSGEHYEHTYMYDEFADIAAEEGYEDIAEKFRRVGEVEKAHEKRYMDLLELLIDEKLYKNENNTIWICQKCGNIHIGKTPPDKCQVCEHENTYFARK